MATSTTPKQQALRDAAGRAKAKREAAKAATAETPKATRRRNTTADPSGAPRGGAHAAKRPSTRNEGVAVADAQLSKALMAGLAKGKTVSAMSAELGRPIGKLLMLKMIAEVSEKDIIKGTPAAVSKMIVAARDNGNQSWGQIMARTRDERGNPYTQARVRGIYTEATGTDTRGTSNGRGGRPPAGTTPKPKAAPALRTKAAKPASKASGKRAVKTGTVATTKAETRRKLGVKISA